MRIGHTTVSPTRRRRGLRTGGLVTGVVLAMVLGLLPLGIAAGQSTSQPVRPDTIRLLTEDGTKRQAAIAWSREQFSSGGAQEVILSRDDVFADALSSGGIQCAVDGPLLLSERTTLSTDMRAELTRLGPARVTMMGGTNALSEVVERELVEDGFEVRRLLGPTRIETAIEAARVIHPAAEVAILARAFGSGEDETQAFADSMVAGAAGCLQDVPILLSASDTLSAPLRDYLQGSAIKTVYMTGGADALSDSVAQQMMELGIAVQRVAGDNRAGTAVRMSEVLLEGGKRDLALATTPVTPRAAPDATLQDAGDVPCVILEEGYEPDAWASGFAAARYVGANGCALLLSDGVDLPPETEGYLDGSPDGATPLVCGPLGTFTVCVRAARVLGHDLTTVELDGIGADGLLRGRVIGEHAEVTAAGCGVVPGTPVETGPDGEFELAVDLAQLEAGCTLDVTITYPDGDPFVSVDSFTFTADDVPPEPAPPPPPPPPPADPPPHDPGPSPSPSPSPTAGPATALRLEPATVGSPQPVRSSHTVTAFFEDAEGTPVPGPEGESVLFEVYRDSGDGYLFEEAEILLINDGTATYTYFNGIPGETLGGAGDDIILACLAEDESCAEPDSNPPAPDPSQISGSATTEWWDDLTAGVDSTGSNEYLVTATVSDFAGNPLGDVALWFEVYRYEDGSPVPYYNEFGDRTTDLDGMADYTFEGTFAVYEVAICGIVDEEPAPDDHFYCADVVEGSLVGRDDRVVSFEFVGPS